MIYGIGGAASRLAAIILVPLYTRALSIEDYGLLEILLALHMAAVLISGLQSESAVARDYFNMEKEGKLGQLVWGAVLISVAGTFGLFAIVALLALLGWVPKEFIAYAPWLFAMTLPSQLLGLQLLLLRFQNSPLFFGILSFLDLALGAAFSAFMIIQFDMGISGALAGLFASKTICVLIAWPRTLARGIGLSQSTMLIAAMLRYSLPTMPAVMLSWIQTAGSRVLLAFFLTLNAVAIAGLALKIAALFGFVTYAFRLVWEPYSYERLDKQEADPLFYNRALGVYTVTMFFLAGSVTIMGPFFVAILAPSSYDDAGRLVSFFVFGQFWIGAIPILCVGIHGARVTSKLSYIYAIAAAINLISLILLSRFVGVLAAGVGFLLGAIASAMLARFYSKKYFDSRDLSKRDGPIVRRFSCAAGGINWKLVGGTPTSH